MLNKTRLLTPGPTPLPEVVRLSLARDMIHHRKAEFREIMRSVQPGLKTLFGTEDPVLPLACSGTGAMTAAVYSLFSPGEKVLVIEAGKFGQRWREIAIARQLVVESMEIAPGMAADPAAIGSRLKNDASIAGVLIQLCETSTGVLNPIGEIAAQMAASPALLVVDGISGVGISPCPMDEWHLDCLLTGSQKGLMLPPGLALLALSPRAWGKAAATAPGCFYFNLPKEKREIEKGQTNFTTPINLVMGLAASLEFLLANGLDAVYSKQWALTMMVRAGIEAMGLKLLAPKNFSWGLTSVVMPESISSTDILAELEKKYGVYMANGQDSLKGAIIRFAHMGWVDWGDCLAGLSALGGALENAGVPVDDYLTAAMKAYSLGIATPPGTMPGSFLQ